MTPKFVSCLLPGEGGHHDNLINFWGEVLYKSLQESILGPLIFPFQWARSFLFQTVPPAVAVNIMALDPHVFGDILG